ncbi:MAG: phenylalanine--tRNA ligase beta subunit-related protein [Bacteroidota bacterium]
MANVKVEASTQDFKDYANHLQGKMLKKLSETKETELPVIKATRSAYKATGKEPSRYRPSAEALLRRLRTKRSLYQINNVVDCINLISMHTHYSIGGFDIPKIDGEVVCDIGTSDPYKAIGRGELNIEFMPGLRDDQGFFGTPTSDSERTMVMDHTTQLLLVYYDFHADDSLNKSLDFGIEILETYCQGKSIQKLIVV